jgi:membrane protein DedA with SNARE-associated domain
LARATAFVARRGVLAVFLSRWLFSPLGPYANLATGAIGFGWLRFSLAGIAGEAIWVGLYTSIGYGFAGNLTAASAFASSILGFVPGVGPLVRGVGGGGRGGAGAGGLADHSHATPP